MSITGIYAHLFINLFIRDSIKNADLTECFSERFLPSSDIDVDFNQRQLEIHLSDGKFQCKQKEGDFEKFK